MLVHDKKGKIVQCDGCFIPDYCIDVSHKYRKLKPFYLCEFCRRALSRDLTGTLHATMNLNPNYRKN